MPAKKTPAKKKATKKTVSPAKKKTAAKKKTIASKLKAGKKQSAKKIAPKKAKATTKKIGVSKKPKTLVKPSVKPVDISIGGDMYECNYIEITPQQFRSLKKANEEGNLEDFFEENYSLSDSIFGDSVINGFTFEDDYVNFRVHVDGELQSNLVRDFLIQNKNDAISETRLEKQTPSKTYYLIFEKWCSGGYMNGTVLTAYDPSKLGVGTDSCTLPNGTTRTVAYLSYEDVDLEFDSSSTSSQELYLYSTDGTTIELDY